MDCNYFNLIFLAIPFVCLTVMYVVLTLVNRGSSGEIKFILPPDIFLKVLAVFMLGGIVFVLASAKIISAATTGALIGAMVSGTLGISPSEKKSMDRIADAMEKITKKDEPPRPTP